MKKTRGDKRLAFPFSKKGVPRFGIQAGVYLACNNGVELELSICLTLFRIHYRLRRYVRVLGSMLVILSLVSSDANDVRLFLSLSLPVNPHFYIDSPMMEDDEVVTWGEEVTFSALASRRKTNSFTISPLSLGPPGASMATYCNRFKPHSWQS
jgi:hypothetical protein